VMAYSLLGTNTRGVIDLHSGGEDNIFPHHECEIAQTCAATGADNFARYWFHTRHLIVDGEKMSKSKGNFYTVRDLLKRGASPAAIRLEIIRTHYRINANFTFQGLQDCQRQIDRWAKLKEWLEKHRTVKTNVTPLTDAMPAFKAALCSDMNVAGAIGAMNEAVGAYNLNAPPVAGAGPGTYADELAALEQMDSVVGVLSLDRQGQASHDDLNVQMIEQKLADRTAARKAKDFKRGDEIRDELLAMGIAIKDVKNPDGTSGTTWTRVMK
jgi:cysteinyl-tRNA synthetase